MWGTRKAYVLHVHEGWNMEFVQPSVVQIPFRPGEPGLAGYGRVRNSTVIRPRCSTQQVTELALYALTGEQLSKVISLLQRHFGTVDYVIENKFQQRTASFCRRSSALRTGSACRPFAKNKRGCVDCV